MFHPEQLIVVAGVGPAAIDFSRQRAEKDIVDQSGFAAAGNARDYGEQPQWDLDIDTFEIVMPGAHN
jgi:hypothetical protein